MPRVSDEYIEKKRREIIEAAMRVCARKPVASVEMQDVIREAGFSHGVIYRYYSDLDEVLRDLVITINSEHRIDDKIDEILGNEAEDWEAKIRQICGMLAEQMKAVGVEIMKISLYCDTLAYSDPERALRIAEKLGDKMGDKGQSPLIPLVAKMSVFLDETIRNEGLTPMRTVSEMMQFMLVTFQGIQTGYVMANCLETDQISGQYDPIVMFGCLADSLIAMIKGIR